MTVTVDHILQSLDWQPEPVPCGCHRHGEDGCPGVAVKKISLHALHSCRGGSAHWQGEPGRSVDGDVVQLMCAPCAAESRRLASALIDQWQHRIASDMTLVCIGCQRALDHVDDIVRVEDLDC